LARETDGRARRTGAAATGDLWRTYRRQRVRGYAAFCGLHNVGGLFRALAWMGWEGKRNNRKASQIFPRETGPQGWDGKFLWPGGTVLKTAAAFAGVEDYWGARGKGRGARRRKTPIGLRSGEERADHWNRKLKVQREALTTKKLTAPCESGRLGKPGDGRTQKQFFWQKFGARRLPGQIRRGGSIEKLGRRRISPAGPVVSERRGDTCYRQTQKLVLNRRVLPRRTV